MRKMVIFVLLSLALTSENLHLENPRVKFTVYVKGGKLEFETLSLPARKAYITVDGDFAVDVVWTGWRAPGKVNNSENPVVFTKKDFRLNKVERGRRTDGTLYLKLLFIGKPGLPIRVELLYALGPRDFFVRRRIRVYDPEYGLHFLRRIFVYKTMILSRFKTLKEGGYGQPAAIRSGKSGAFWGLEYPGGTSVIRGKEARVFQYIGEKIGAKGIWSDPAVFAITPDPRVRYWFFQYLDSIRTAPLRPYLLYNSWYDLRAPEMVKDPRRVMNQENALRTAKLLGEKLGEYGIKLDAFVLDDGWDNYRSDWALSKAQFPRGFSPLVNLLSGYGTSLGLWFGPIGGYSHRDWRVSWMAAHGYETVADQMCFGGRKYYALFRKRVMEMVKNYRVGYFKWDGFQFSCSEEGHGHPLGIYSRRAILKKLIQLVRTVRRENPEIFLNITSGTWLSPWWLLYANTIWMQGSDYGYANVPSISRRDRAMTYRDYVLYDNLVKKDLWFPISNLMTHGIIKGHLQKLGGESEPIDKFTNNAVLYFARGISMFELYISPDLLSNREWEAIAKSYLWAKDRFPLLVSYTRMIGGNPGEGKAYGFVHFKGQRGIISLRNPSMEPQRIKIRLKQDLGLSEEAKELVLEREYPFRSFSGPYSYGDTLEFNLQGYETSVYEIYPLREASFPVIKGAEVSMEKRGPHTLSLRIYRTWEKPGLLNRGFIREILREGRRVKKIERISQEKLKIRVRLRADGDKLIMKIDIPEKVKKATFALLLKGKKAGKTGAEFYLDGERTPPRVESQEGAWTWFKIPLKKGRHTLGIKVNGPCYREGWIITLRELKPAEYIVKTERVVSLRPTLPLPYPPGTLREITRVF